MKIASIAKIAKDVIIAVFAKKCGCVSASVNCNIMTDSACCMDAQSLMIYTIALTVKCA